MIKLIYGAKGTGKTTKVINMANEEVKTSNALIVFVTDNNGAMFELNNKVRFLDTTEYNVKGTVAMLGFLKGLIAANSDNHSVYLDGIARIADAPLSELKTTFEELEALGEKHGITYVVTVSSAREDMPAYLEKYL